MNSFSGFLLIDKPVGITSFDVIRRLRRLTGVKRIGHTGTLDPFASGLLICAVGSYTRLCSLVEAEDKSYIATVKLGEQTNTGDTEGEVISSSPHIPDSIPEQELASKVLRLTTLETPKFSAVKIQGKPAYDYARKGLDISLPPRTVSITQFNVLSYKNPYLEYCCTVSKGTYIRSLSEIIAQLLGTVGYTVQLRRTSIGRISVDNSIALDALEVSSGQISAYPAREVLAEYPQVILSASAMLALRNGQAIADEGEDMGKIVVFCQQGTVLGIAERRSGYLHPLVNLN